MTDEQEAELRYEAGMYQALYENAKNRIEALEAALREIAELADSDDGISPREAIEIASVALAEEQDK
jgi:hypothetical protein